MEAGETLQALSATRELSRELWKKKNGRLSPDRLNTAFRALLKRRGYFVESPSELRESLDDIRAVGEGFDLYELARALAELDTIVSECLKIAPARVMPELKPFVHQCPCGEHPVSLS